MKQLVKEKLQEHKIENKVLSTAAWAKMLFYFKYFPFVLA